MAEKKIELLKKYGVFLLIIIVMFFLLIGSILLARNSWKEGLKKQVETVLVEQKNDYRIGNFVKINSPFSTSCAVYELNKKNSKQNGEYAVIIRLTTLYGQIPAVYLYNEKDENAEFVRFISLDGTAEKQIQDISKDMQISFWKKRIPSMLKNINKGVK